LQRKYLYACVIDGCDRIDECELFLLEGLNEFTVSLRKCSSAVPLKIRFGREGAVARINRPGDNPPSLDCNMSPQVASKLLPDC